jgi:hypothetical protein
MRQEQARGKPEPDKPGRPGDAVSLSLAAPPTFFDAIDLRRSFR